MSEASSPEPQSSEQDFAKLRSLEAQRAWLKERRIHNPYFNTHEGIAGAHSCIDGRDFINFASYNYSGLCGDPRVSAAAKAAIDQYGTSVSASRIVSGQRNIHSQLEEALASFLHTEDALTFVSGHLTNVTVISELVGPGDLVLHDTYIHNSAMLGCRLARAHRMSFRHNDYEGLDALLTKHRGQHKHALILTEGVYSMDGDIPDIPRLLQLKQKHNTQLMVDEAHSTGVLGKTGRGVGEYFDLKPDDIDLWMGTLSKAFASCGGYVAGRREFIDTLRYFTPGVMFSVGLPPSGAAAALCAIECLKAEPERVTRVQARARQFREIGQHLGWNIGKGRDSAIVPLIVGDSERALRLADNLCQKGINRQPIVYPGGALDQARLRFFFCAEHSEQDILTTTTCISQALTELA